MSTEHRHPYVGEGASGARRSAMIDEDEALTYPPNSKDRLQRLDSARRWRRQAAELERTEWPNVRLAADRYRERKRAAGITDTDTVEEDALRRLWLGWDLDLEQMHEAVALLLQHYSALMAGGGELGPVEMTAGAFSEGVATGLMLADLRAEHHARKDPDA
jgi:hypothetical protein